MWGVSNKYCLLTFFIDLTVVTSSGLIDHGLATALQVLQIHLDSIKHGHLHAWPEVL